MCKVSIIVPIYNAEQYIKRCLDALANQSLDDYEVILINDGSTDGTLDILNKYNIRYPNIFKVISIPNGGQGKARNEGIKYAKGEFLAFADSDDFMEPGMYEELYNFAVKYNYELVICPYFRMNQSGHILNTELNYLDNITMINTSPWNKLFKRDLWLKHDVQFAEALWYEDVLAVYEYVFISNSIGFYKKPLYYYIYREESSINIYNDRVNDIFKVLDLLYVYLKERGLLEIKGQEIEAVFILHAILGHLSRCVEEKSLIKRHKYIQDSKNYIKNKFKGYYKNKYMKLEKPLKKNSLINYSRFICSTAMRFNLFDFVLIGYRFLRKSQLTFKRW